MTETDPNPRSVRPSPVTEWNDGAIHVVSDSLVGEEPVQILVSGQPLSVTMRTPGDDAELAAGFLLTEGIITSREEILGIRLSDDGGAVDVELPAGAVARSQETKRNFLSNSGCGLCGKTSIDSIYTVGIERPNPDFRIEAQVLCGLPDTLRSAQAIFGKTGGLHAAALFDCSGRLLALREDVGRHNAVDKLVGWALMQGMVPLSNQMLLASGRGGFEIIQKSLKAGIPLLASVSAASSLAVQMAGEFGMTLIGFLRGRRFIVYSGEERLGLACPVGRSTPFQLS